MTSPTSGSSPSPEASPQPVPSPEIEKTAAALADSGGQVDAPKLELRQAVITAVNLAAATCSVAIGGDATSVPNVHYLSNYKPTVNDTCWILVNGPDLLALDRDGKFGSAAFAGLQSTTIGTTETRSSTSYGDLATTGPQVVVTVPASGRLMIQIGCYISGPDGFTEVGGAASFAMSGANSLSAVDDNMLSMRVAHGDAATAISGTATSSRVSLLTGLTPGSTTITAKYRAWDSGVAMSFAYRSLWALPL